MGGNFNSPGNGIVGVFASWATRSRARRLLCGGLLGCAAALVAFSSTQTVAWAQVSVVDSHYYEEANPLIAETIGFYKTKKCITQAQLDNFKRRADLMGEKLRAGYDALWKANDSDPENQHLPFIESGPYGHRLADGRRKLGQLNYMIKTLSTLPRCRPLTDAEREAQLKLIRRLRTGVPEPEVFEERTEIGARIGMPRTEAVSFTGFSLSGGVVASFNGVNQTEIFKPANVVTNQFSDSSDSAGGYIGASYLFALRDTPIRAGPFLSVDVLNQDTNHTFPPGPFFLGQTINAIATVGGQIGIVATPNLFVYGEVGAAFVSVTQKLNFLGPVTTADNTVTGLNLGIGATFQPPGWQVAGNPMAVFFQFNKLILPVTTFNNPGTTNFAYDNRNDINKFEAGFRVYFGERKVLFGFW
jgi:hypothetical protein